MGVNIGTVVALANGIANKVANANFMGFEYRSTEATTTTFAIKFLLNNAEVEYLMTVPNGVAGTNGIDGQDGTNIIDANFVGNDLVFTLSDSSLITLTNAKLDLKGDKGEQGIQGIQGLKGTDGREIEITKDTTYIKWRYVGDSTWNNLVTLADLKGDSASVDLTNYALKSWVSEQIATVSGGGTVDLSRYALKIDLDTKVDKVEGKGLSTNDFTTEEKNKLAELNNNLIFENVESGEVFTSIEENIECTNISLSSNSLTFNDSISQTLIVTLTPNNTTEKVVWSSDNPNIVTVDNGTVTPLKNGSCVITATCGTQSDICNIEVSGILKQFTITNNLTNIMTNNNNKTVTENSPYNAMLTANDNFEINAVTVTINGIDVTSTCYLNGIISINSVNGNIIITATATSTVVTSDILAKVEAIDGNDYLIVDNILKIQNATGASSFASNTYSNEIYQVYTFVPSFNSIWDKTKTQPLITLKNSMEIIQATNLLSALISELEGNLIIMYNGAIYLRLYKNLGGFSNVEEYLQSVYGGLKFALVSQYLKKEINPNNITSITIKLNDTTCQYAQFGYSDLPTRNIYTGANSLGISTGENANLSASSFTPTACMSTTTLSIRFKPNTFTDFTLNAVKEYLSKNPLIFWYV